MLIFITGTKDEDHMQYSFMTTSHFTTWASAPERHAGIVYRSARQGKQAPAIKGHISRDQKMKNK